jgi:hypothetical protein
MAKADENAIARYRNWYAKLLRLYPKAYRERFGEPMQQTFHDLCRERAEAEQGLLAFALWVFVETSAGIIRENATFMIMQNTKRLIVWAIVAALMLAIPLAMQFTDEVQWNEAVAYSVILLVAGGTYELWQWLKTRTSAYRFALGVGLAGAILLGWVNGAVGIIGSEDNPANLMYGAVFVVGLIGSVMTRFRPRGMAHTLFAAALVQLLVPVVAFFVWPAQASWGEAGVIGVFIINLIFAMLFVVSALLFRKAQQNEPPAVAGLVG